MKAHKKATIKKLIKRVDNALETLIETLDGEDENGEDGNVQAIMDELTCMRDQLVEVANDI